MSTHRTIARLLSVFCFALAASSAACAPMGDELAVAEGDFADLDADELRYSTRQTDRWVYNGMLPALERPRVVASLRGHTVRVTGLLPAGYSEPLPFYATATPEGARTRVTVVYPIATGATTNGPGEYPDVRGVPWLPYAQNSRGEWIEWGGFPFLEYNHRRGLAFHGPITHSGTEWRLRRGPVSHGCNRMQGEHVVELAHLIGFEMDEFQRQSSSRTVTVPVSIIGEYDQVDGQYVDVNYPADPRVALPPRDRSRVFPTWDSRDFPRFVCAYKAGRAFDAHHCDYMPAPLLDPQTGVLDPNDHVLVDNTDTSSVTSAGAWQTSTGRPGFVGTNYLALAAGASGTATFAIEPPSAGRFEVWARYIPHTNRNTRVLYTVHAGGSAAPQQVRVNQRTGEGWIRLGTYTLGAGAQVVVDGTGGDGYTIADAVRIDRVN